MRPVCARRALLVLATVSLAAPTGAQVFEAVDRGWYDATGFHDPSNTDYHCGVCQAFCPETEEHRNWFLFDLEGVTGTVTTATLELALGETVSYDYDEIYRLFDVDTLHAALVVGIGGVAGFEDLGSSSWILHRLRSSSWTSCTAPPSSSTSRPSAISPDCRSISRGERSTPLSRRSSPTGCAPRSGHRSAVCRGAPSPV